MIHTSAPIPAVEALSFRALPALETRHYDGWLLRFADGYTRRSNSVNPLFCSSLEIDKKIDYCEALFGERGLPTYFKLTEHVFPADLDAILQQRGYQKEAPTSVQLLELSGITPEVDERVKISHHLRDTWLGDFARLNGVRREHRRILKKMLQITHVTKLGYAALTLRHKPACMGLGVLDGEYLGLFDIVTDAKQRRKGYGRSLINSLLHWGKAHGARYAYLQVMLDNEPALKLYQTLGFQEQYHYWYRRQPGTQ